MYMYDPTAEELGLRERSKIQTGQETQSSKFIIGIGILSLMVVIGISIYALGIGAASTALLGKNMVEISVYFACLAILTAWLCDGLFKKGVAITVTATLTDLAIGTVFSTWPAIGPVAIIIAAVVILTIGAVYKGKASFTSEDLGIQMPLQNEQLVPSSQNNLTQQAACPIELTSHTATQPNALDFDALLQTNALLQQFTQREITVSYDGTEETSDIQRFTQLEKTLSDQKISINVRFTKQPANSCVLSLTNNTLQPKNPNKPLWCCLQYDTNSATQEKTVYLSGIYEMLNRIWQNHPQCPSYRQDDDAQGSDPLKTLRC